MSDENTSSGDPQVLEFTQEIFEAIHGAMNSIVRRHSLFMEAQVAMEGRLNSLEEKVEKLLDTTE